MLLLLRRNLDNHRPHEPQAVVLESVRRGTTMMEYLMMLSLIVTFCLVAIGYLGGTNNGNMSGSADLINKATTKKGN